jgi:hypothetical protein
MAMPIVVKIAVTVPAVSSTATATPNIDGSVAKRRDVLWSISTISRIGVAVALVRDTA